MRNAIQVGENIVTIDNAGCIGEKPQDEVQVPNEVTGYFTARTAILEQWCAGAMPVQLLLANFSGDDAWQSYINGFQQVFNEINQPMPPVTGSSETNFQALQSAVSLTMLGKKAFASNPENCQYFVVGEPLVGNEVINNPQKIASLGELYTGLKEGFIQALWPTGSKGIGIEIERFIGCKVYETALPLQKSAGPSCAVLVAVNDQNIQSFFEQMTAPITEINLFQ
ncbi:hypothetical protein CSE16_05415 [Solibacillus sp. R5-41]|uniref:hypothetical protein n=1 Tax=Solibacillus sp. R5-41 TaxID=2048654 RepID=UPI000C1278BE|nr:hypothetical protein [Solibacillus sp. R5-41]ATP39534.1 hypothetical protein CSE16_05415 [Solibacillus sp. R5-41]